jgi:hypothetical protein
MLSIICATALTTFTAAPTAMNTTPDAAPVVASADREAALQAGLLSLLSQDAVDGAFARVFGSADVDQQLAAASRSLTAGRMAQTAAIPLRAGRAPTQSVSIGGLAIERPADVQLRDHVARVPAR